MIEDLITFIQFLTACFREIIVWFDVNEQFIPDKSGTAKIVELTDLIDPLINKYGIAGEPPTHQRGSNRIDFIFCTLGIKKFIISIGFLPTHEFFIYDHRGYILDINLKTFLRFLDHLPTLNTRLLSTQSPDFVLIYKKNLNKYTTKHNIIHQVNNIQYKIDSKTISKSDPPYINEFD